MAEKPSPLTPREQEAAVEAYREHLIGLILAKRIKAETEHILAEARKLRALAEKAGCLDEVFEIMRPATKRGRGRPQRSHSPKLAEERRRLWEAYWREKRKTPNDSVEKIAKRLGGHSVKATAQTLRRMESNAQFWPMIYRRAGIKRKSGAPKKIKRKIPK